MQDSILRELHCRRFSLRARWEVLLRAEPVNSPLGHPDALVHLIDTTLDEVFTTLDNQAGRQPASAPQTSPHTSTMCACGRNPLLAYFAAAEQAIREALILAQAALAPLDPVQRDESLDEVNRVIQVVSRREIEAFCGVCQFRHLALPASVEPLAIGRG
jgi:hypothetical protein